ncbi:MAG: DUF3850 domain-containing protein [Planctomycetes bacterium]|nr:DUF3850 domain-containing protein [Planctomycetota bacterium]
MKSITLKIWPQYYQPIVTGEKKFERRKNDRDYQVGDQLLLREWDPKVYDDEVERVFGRRGTLVMESDGQKAAIVAKAYTGRSLVKTVSYIEEGPGFGLEAGFVVMGLKS